MRLRASGVYTVGLAIAVSLGAVPAARAQVDTTKTRVPVRKEQAAIPAKAQPGAPVTKEAAVPATRPDTTPRVAAGDVVVSKDTAVHVAPATCAMMPHGPPPAARMMPSCGAMPAPAAQPRRTLEQSFFGKSGFYIGASAGTAVPFNLLSDLGYDSGFDLTVPIGWHRPGRPLGVRVTLAYDQVHADIASRDATAPAMRGSAPDPKIYSGTVDAVLKFPVGRLAGEGRGLSLYAVGGGGAYLFRGFGGTTELNNVLGGDRIGSSRRNVHKWGVEAGAGMEYGLGPTAVFIESRWVNVFTDGSRTGNDYLRWIPIGVGVTLR